MVTRNDIAAPDDRVLARLSAGLRQGEGLDAFITAGEALAAALLAAPGPRLGGPARALAHAMTGTLLLMQPGASGAVSPDRRIRLAMAAAVLSVVRPEMAHACDGAVATWMGFGIGSPRRMEDPGALAGRTLLALWLEDPEHAADCVDALLDRGGEGLGGALFDWTVARLQQHGPEREASCFANLRIALGSMQGRGAGASLLVVASLVVLGRHGLPRRLARRTLHGDGLHEDKLRPLPRVARA